LQERTLNIMQMSSSLNNLYTDLGSLGRGLISKELIHSMDSEESVPHFHINPSSAIVVL
jgi:hypothetical protein